MKLEGIKINEEILNHNKSLKEKVAPSKTSFKDLLTDAIEDVNKIQNESDGKIKDLVTGKSQDINATVMAVQQADMSFRMMMNVRNKIIDAYKEIQRGGV
ncbi:MAG: flagellar hook-basal body complex protein FliE [Acidobacteria bacterium]|nr:MAG: flagellar hook-basal body complex protein FliE [Acidobacteriota bacterium]PIE91053.1 MAG: flagellar hook-basal body complex protein FliE [Acidobacteriota bacterium]